MRASVAVASLCALAAPVMAQQSPAPPVGACFQVVEGQADVPPAAPLLVDRCTGETFVLMRVRGRASAHEWVPIAKSKPGAAAGPEASPAAPRAKAAAKEGCFTYSGRSYCP